MKSGERLGRWSLLEKLGQGGNGEVWRCRGQDGVDAAIKVLLKQVNRERLGRFCNEIEFLLGPGQREGVVPILDHNLGGIGKIWYVMPLAVPIRSALGPEPTPERVVDAMAAVTQTLGALAEEGIAHRDVKPDNLLSLRGVWSIGDFGLVKYPAGQALTEHGRKLGPTDFMAPEMRESPDSADPEAADVYSVAKTLWVLLAGVNLPFPGQHRADDDICRLTARLDYRWAPQLDLLIERCTVNDPSKRPRMRDVADELVAMIKANMEPVVVGDLADLERRIAAMTELHHRRDESRGAFNNRVAQASNRLVDEVAKPAYWDLSRRLPTFGTQHPAQVAMPRALVTSPSRGFGSHVWGGMIVAPGSAGVRIDLGVALQVGDGSGNSTIAAVLNVHRRNQGRGWSVSILERLADTTIDSAHFATLLAELRDAYVRCLPEALAAVAEALEDESVNGQAAHRPLSP
jgi:hypothetical protein